MLTSINKFMIPKILYVNGDSFSFGQELIGDQPPETFYNFTEYHRRHCYTGIIADRLNIPAYTNDSLPGGSNQRIYRTTLSAVTKLLTIYEPKDIFVQIGLTHNSRREFFYTTNQQYYPFIANHQPGDYECSILWKNITRMFSSVEDDHIYDQMMILGIQNFLRINKVPYLLTKSMGHQLIYDDEAAQVPAEMIEQRYIDRYYNRPAFSEYVFHHNNCVKAPGGHPLEDGHLLWAEHVLEHIIHNNLFDNSDL
jgi:hypothetical protein